MKSPGRPCMRNWPEAPLTAGPSLPADQFTPLTAMSEVNSVNLPRSSCSQARPAIRPATSGGFTHGAQLRDAFADDGGVVHPQRRAVLGGELGELARIECHDVASPRQSCGPWSCDAKEKNCSRRRIRQTSRCAICLRTLALSKVAKLKIWMTRIPNSCSSSFGHPYEGGQTSAFGRKPTCFSYQRRRRRGRDLKL